MIILKTQNAMYLSKNQKRKSRKNLYREKDLTMFFTKKLKAPMVFATDGIFTKTFHPEKRKPLYLNKDEVEGLIRQSLAIQYVHNNEYLSVDKK